jgi:GNAT superfamily N-acetyltransferase
LLHRRDRNANPRRLDASAAYLTASQRPNSNAAPAAAIVVAMVIRADAAEMNALEAGPQGQGIGTALILAGEQEARRRAAPIPGLAVEVQNQGAGRLYERLGRSRREPGLVIDRSTQSDDQGNIVREHADECFILRSPQ